jgi:hypothetical protein
MRYSIMLQIVTGITLILLGGAGLFAWIQNRPNPPQKTSYNSTDNHFGRTIFD